MHYDCFNKNSGCLHTTPFTGNFDGICLFLHGYELFRTGSCSFELVASGLDGCGYSRVGGCRCFRVVADGFRWFRVVSDFFGWFVVSVVTGNLLIWIWHIQWKRKSKADIWNRHSYSKFRVDCNVSSGNFSLYLSIMKLLDTNMFFCTLNLTRQASLATFTHVKDVRKHQSSLQYFLRSPVSLRKIILCYFLGFSGYFFRLNFCLNY